MPINLREKDIPTKLDPCPIVDTSAEIRFVPTAPNGAVFGILYHALSSEFPEENFGSVQQLPILSFPEQVINANPELVTQPHYKIQTNSFVMQIGPRVLSVGYSSNYPGWETYRRNIERVFNKIQQCSLANEIERIGLRYINFFKGVDIFDNIEISETSENSFLSGKRSVVRTEIDQGNDVILLQLSNTGSFLRPEGLEEFGSFLDIDVSKTVDLHGFFENIGEQLDRLHDVEKRTVFGLLKKEYIDTFNPVY